MNKLSAVKLFFLLVVSVTTACADSDKSSKQNVGLPVTILDGLSLGSLLAEPEELNSVDKLESSLDKDWYAGISVRLLDNAAAQEEVKNCRDYFKVLKDGKQPVKEYERSAYIEFGLMCLAASDAAKAKPSKKSYLKSFVLDINAPKVLPKVLAMQLSQTEYEKMLDDKSKVYWGDVNKIIGLEKVNDNKVIFKLDNAQQEIDYVARGDFNNDGIEDILITSRDSVADGSYTSIRMFLLTKKSSSSGFELLKEYKAI